MRAKRPVLILLGVAAVWTAAPGQDAQRSLESASRQLSEATVTVRVRNRLPGEDSAAAGGEVADGAGLAVTVCTGVLVAPRLVVTPIFSQSASEIRITVPGGEQTQARLRVLDEYSGLALLQTESPLPAPIALSPGMPPVGSWVLSAAAWGTEQPAVSVGILGAAQRTLAGTNYPPLLQCDLRTAGTSSGAAVVDGQGRLIGVVVATDADQDRRGWTYAVPAAHVQRLLAAADQRDDARVVILKRRRPVIGMVLDGRGDHVVVSRVLAGSPAEVAGIRVGDRVLTADGITIRSVYQAVRPLLYKQPGDKMVFVLDRGGRQLSSEVSLGGGSELPATPVGVARQNLRPTVAVQRIGDGIYSAEGAGELREVVSPGGEAASGEPPRQATAAEKIQLLERALDRYQRAIASLQDRLQQGEQQRRETDELIRSLQQQVEELQQQLESR